MPRQAQLGKKNGQWFTKAGKVNGKSVSTYFGSVKDVPHAEAKRRFAAHLVTVSARRRQEHGLSVAELVVAFLEWIHTHRGERTYLERKLHLDRFAHFRVNGKRIGELAAIGCQADDLLGFLAHVATHEWIETTPGAWAWMKRSKPLDAFTVGKHDTSIRACFAWGAGRKNPSPCIPGFHPFAGMERYKRPAEPLLEGELPTSDEIRALFKHADCDFGVINEKGSYRARRDDEARIDHHYKGFADMLKVYHQTGARTSELAEALVSHFNRSARQIVLAKHKRAKTLKDSTTRRITLPDESFAIVARLCDGKNAGDAIFTDPGKRPWTRLTLASRFKMVRNRAGVRKDVIIYSYRHLWISEALMNGIDIATVAKMAGTSIGMIEKVYGHFTNDHFAEAQKKMEDARKAKEANAVALSVA